MAISEKIKHMRMTLDALTESVEGCDDHEVRQAILSIHDSLDLLEERAHQS